MYRMISSAAIGLVFSFPAFLFSRYTIIATVATAAAMYHRVEGWHFGQTWVRRGIRDPASSLCIGGRLRIDGDSG